MKISYIPFAGLLALSVLAGCKPSTDGKSASNAPAQAPAPKDIQAPANGPAGQVEIPVAANGAEPLLLPAANGISGSFNAPKGGDIHAAGIQIGNFGGTADGTVSLKLCQADKCQEATANLAGSSDNNYLEFQFSAPLTVTASNPVSYTFTRVGGTQTFAVWTYPTSTDGKLTLTDGTKVARDAKIALTF